MEAKKYSFGLILGATALLVACGGSPTASPKLASKSSANQLTAAAAVQFGLVPVGRTVSSSVAITNAPSNNAQITVSQINVSGASFKLGNTPALPMILAPGESVTLGVKFSPLTRGSASGQLSIKSDATDPELPISLSGNGNTSTSISVSPSVLNFGNIGVGAAATLTGTLIAGNSSVTVSTVDQAGQGYSLSGISFPVTLSPGEQLPFSVTFAPQASGSASGSLAFVTDASVTPTESLVGTGGQSSGHSVDLSWNGSSSSVLGYNVYRAVRSGGPYVKMTASPIAGTNYSDSAVQSGTTYYYVATSISNGQESSYSNQTVAVIP